MIRSNDRFLSQLYAFCDLVIIEIILFFAWWLKFRSGLLFNMDYLPLRTYLFWNLVFGVIIITMGYFFGLYSPKRKKNVSYEFLKVGQVHLISFFIFLSVLFFLKEVHISREVLGIALVLNIIGICTYRLIVKKLLKYIRQKGYNKRFILIVGAGSLGKNFYKNLKLYPELGYEVVGFLDDYVQNGAFDEKLPKVIGKIEELDTILRARLIDEVIIALPLDAHHKIGAVINICEGAGAKALIIPDYYDYLPAKPFFDNFAGIPLINIRDIPLDELRNRFFKRTFDILFSLIAIILTSPLLLLISIGVKISSPGPVIFKQERVGLNRRNFNMYKFRSMRISSEAVTNTSWSSEKDPRKTKFGTFIRKTSLDELPQFFNVLFGHMSVVGPRPERPFFVEQFRKDIPKYMVKHHIRPGITGWAQANGLRGDTSIEERIKHDIYYIENWTFLFDAKIICKTIVNGFVNKNAY